MVEIKKIVSTLNGKALGGAKIPHSVSNPVLRVVDDVPYIAAFVYIYNRENIQQNKSHVQSLDCCRSCLW